MIDISLRPGYTEEEIVQRIDSSGQMRFLLPPPKITQTHRSLKSPVCFVVIVRQCRLTLRALAAMKATRRNHCYPLSTCAGDFLQPKPASGLRLLLLALLSDRIPC